MSAAVASEGTRRRLRDRVESLVSGLVDGAPRAPKGAIVRLDVPSLEFSHTAVAGIARADGTPLTPAHAFHVASVGKLMTATLVMQLVEAGRFGPTGVDARLGELGLLEDVLLDRLHVRDGIARGREITLRQLLTHTAGLGDAFADGASGTAEALGQPAPDSLAPALWSALKARRDGAPQTPDLSSKVWAIWDPERADEPDAGLLNRYLAQLGRAPVAPPGARFHYSDQGFVLLALLAERATGQPYAALQRTRIFEPLGLAHSWMHLREPPPDGLAALECDVWLNGVPLQSLGANLSFDFGGGGQVMTVDDLQRFFDALLAGALFARADTLAAMTTWTTPPEMPPPRVAIGLGLQRWAMPSDAVSRVGHAGAWGTHLWRDERTGATVAGTVNQRDPGAWAFRLLDDVQSLLEE